MLSAEKILLRSYKNGKLVAIEDVTGKTTEELEAACSFQDCLGRSWAIHRLPPNAPMTLQDPNDNQNGISTPTA